MEAPERLNLQCGEYRNRTDDLLTASQNLLSFYDILIISNSVCNHRK